MSLKKMSITKAMEIIHFYRDVEDKGNGQLLPCSLLPLEDLSHATNLILADVFKNEWSTDWIKNTPISKYSNYFIPDELYEELHNCPFESKERKCKQIQFSTEYFNLLKSDVFYSKLESAESILEYCKNIGRENENYWQLVYKRLGLEIDNSDNKLDLTQNIRRKKAETFTTYSIITLILSLIISLFFISNRTRENLGYDLLKALSLFISYFITKMLIQNFCLKNDKPLNTRNKIFYNIVIIFCCYIASLFLSNMSWYGAAPGSSLNYNLVFEYFIIITISSFFGAYKGYAEDRKWSKKERLQKRYENEK